MRAGCRPYMQSAPANYLELLAPLSAQVQRPRCRGASTDVIHVFATRRAILGRALAVARARLRPDAALWVSGPKKASGVAIDITGGTIRELALPLGLVDIKVCAVDATWSGLKLVMRKSARPAAPRTTRTR
jgi:hypothetical protein